MQPDFWHQRWSENQIGFHQSAPTPLLLKHWPTLGIAPGAQVFVPLAGKSLDMAWLASQGHRVLGVELSQLAVEQFFATEQPEYVFLAAAKVGGILANDSYPADFLYDNLMIEANLIEGARQSGVEKLLFLGSSCIYPKFAEQPIVEEALLTGQLEPTNEWYAIAKIAAAIRQPGGQEAVNLKVAEKAVEAYGQLAQKNNTMIVPGNMSEVSGLIASAMQMVGTGKQVGN